MGKKLRDFRDKTHDVVFEYYDVLDEYEAGTSTRKIKARLKELIEKDPDFLDPYISLYGMLLEENKTREAEEILDEAYRRALALITDEKGNWPDSLPWGWLENRHIIRTLVNKAVSLWDQEKTDEALEMFRKLLRTNPSDNAGVRFYILAIRLNMSLEEFEKKFDKGGFYLATEIDGWFEENSKKFPDEFEWWWEEVMKYEEDTSPGNSDDQK